MEVEEKPSQPEPVPQFSPIPDEDAVPDERTEMEVQPVAAAATSSDKQNSPSQKTFNMCELRIEYRTEGVLSDDIFVMGEFNSWMPEPMQQQPHDPHTWVFIQQVLSGFKYRF